MCEHYKVKLLLALPIVGVKVLCGIGQVSLELGAEQQVGVHVVAVGCCLLAYGIAHGKREVTLCGDGLAVLTAYLYGHLLVWCQGYVIGVSSVGCYVEPYGAVVVCLQGVVHYKELALGKRCVAGKEYGAVHALAQAVCCEGEAVVSCIAELLVVAHCSAVDDDETEFVGVGEVACHVYVYPAVGLSDVHHYALCFYGGQVELVLLLLALAVCHRHLCAVLCSGLGGKYKRALAEVLWCCLKEWLAVLEDGDSLLAEKAVLSAQLVCHAACHSCHEVTTLGEEVKCGVRELCAYPLAVAGEASAAVEHVLEVPVVGVDLVEHCEHAAEHGVLAPVEHVACICAYLVVAREQQRVQLELAVAAAVIVYLVLLGLYNIAFGCDQLHVEHLAQGARAVVCAERYVCLEPHCLAKIVGAVVEVQVYALLLHHLSHLHRAVGNAVESVLCSGQSGCTKYDGQ